MKFFLKAGVSVPKGFTSVDSFDPSDLFIVGYPKSGNTWLQDLVSAIVYGVSPLFCPPQLSHELVTDVHFKKFYRRYSRPAYFKSHHLPRPEYRRVVYLLRDGRDVMVSYYHHNTNLAGHQVDFMRMVRDGEGLAPSKWHEHVKSWRENPHQAEIMTIKYEDLKCDAAGQMARFCEFAGIKRDTSFLAEMCSLASFTQMQTKEAKLKEYVLDDWPKDKLFRRRGQIGSYADEMPPDVLRAFLSDAGETLQECGYL